MANGKTRSEVKSESTRKGAVAGAAAVATGVGAAIGAAPLLLVGGAVGTGVLTYRWWKHRAKNGIKF